MSAYNFLLYVARPYYLLLLRPTIYIYSQEMDSYTTNYDQGSYLFSFRVKRTVTLTRVFLISGGLHASERALKASGFAFRGVGIALAGVIGATRFHRRQESGQFQRNCP